MLGNAGKKLQKMVDLAEELYERMNQLREQLRELETTVEETNTTVQEIETEQTEQRALIEAIAAEQGVDVDSVLDNRDTE